MVLESSGMVVGEKSGWLVRSGETVAVVGGWRGCMGRHEGPWKHPRMALQNTHRGPCRHQPRKVNSPALA